MRKIFISLILILCICTNTYGTNILNENNEQIESVLNESSNEQEGSLLNESVNNQLENTSNEISSTLNTAESSIPNISEEERNSFIYAIIIVVAVSMLFENILKYLLELIENNKENKEKKKKYIKILLGVLLLYAILFISSYFIFTFGFKYRQELIWACLFVSFWIVILSTFLKINLFRRKKKDDSTYKR